MTDGAGGAARASAAGFVAAFDRCQRLEQDLADGQVPIALVGAFDDVPRRFAGRRLAQHLLPDVVRTCCRCRCASCRRASRASASAGSRSSSRSRSLLRSLRQVDPELEQHDPLVGEHPLVLPDFLQLRVEAASSSISLAHVRVAIVSLYHAFMKMPILPARRQRAPVAPRRRARVAPPRRAGRTRSVRMWRGSIHSFSLFAVSPRPPPSTPVISTAPGRARPAPGRTAR